MAKRAKRVYVVSLGCSKNLVDTEQMLGLMDTVGVETTGDIERSDCLLVNTCAFTEEAREETLSTLREVAAYKSNGRKRSLVVTGCMAGRFGDLLKEEIPEIDALLPLGTYRQLPEVLARLLRFDPGCPTLPDDAPLPRRLATPGHTAYLRISEGCDHTCAFCAIPAIRGRFRSVPLEQLVDEAAALASVGVRELSLIAEDSTYYGLDIYRKFRLPELLRALNDVNGVEWIRLLYAYPTLVTPELIETVARCEHVCNYVDMPVQHGNDTVLKAMRRGITRARILEMVEAWRAAMPDIVLRTSVIVGFPGETDEAFEDLLSLLEAARFNHVAIFRYSQEQGTRAHDLEGQLPEAIKLERLERAQALVSRHAQDANEALVGQTLRVLIDQPSDVYVDHMQGRWQGQTPDIDGCVFVKGEHTPGTFVDARIMAADTFDLFGVTAPVGQVAPAS